MYLKKKKVGSSVYYIAMQSVNGKETMLEHLGTIEQMIRHARLAKGKWAEGST